MLEQGSTQAGQQDALRTAQREIEGVREIMTENIERVLERGEHMSVLVDKTGRLGENARDFRVRSRTLKRRMWWKNVKLMVLLVLVVIFLLYLFVGFGCGLPGMFLPLWKPSDLGNHDSLTFNRMEPMPRSLSPLLATSSTIISLLETNNLNHVLDP